MDSFDFAGATSTAETAGDWTGASEGVLAGAELDAADALATGAAGEPVAGAAFTGAGAFTGGALA